MPPFGDPLCSLRFQSSQVKSLGNLIQVVREEAVVDVQCHGGARVAKHALDCLDIGTGANGQAGGSVAEVVRREGAEAKTAYGRVEDSRRKLLLSRSRPAALAKTSSPGSLPATRRVRSSTSKRGGGTSRLLWFFGVTASISSLPPGMFSATSSRRRNRSSP